jgi:hypothetical protein
LCHVGWKQSIINHQQSNNQSINHQSWDDARSTPDSSLPSHPHSAQLFAVEAVKAVKATARLPLPSPPHRYIVDPWNALGLVVNAALLVLTALKLSQVRGFALQPCILDAY